MNENRHEKRPAPIPDLPEIRRRASALWVQYPGAPLDFIVFSLEYESGVRAQVLRRALSDLEPTRE